MLILVSQSFVSDLIFLLRVKSGQLFKVIFWTRDFAHGRLKE